MNWADDSPWANKRALLMKLMALDAAGFPDDADLRRTVIHLNLTFTETRALAEAMVRYLERPSKRGRKPGGSPLRASDRKQLAQLEEELIFRKELTRPLSWKEIESIAAAAVGDGVLDTKRERLHNVYREMLSEREAHQGLMTRPIEPEIAPPTD